MTAEQTDLFNSNRDLAYGAAGKFPIAGEDEYSIRQEALIGLRNAALAFDPSRGRFEPFAKRVIKNHLISTYRNARSRQVELLVLDEPLSESQNGESQKDNILDREATPATQTERNEIRSALKDGLAALTSSQRAVLEQYAKGVSFAQVSRETGASEQAVRQMFQRGVNQMRPHLECRGVSTAQFMPGGKHSSETFKQPFHTPAKKRSEQVNLSRSWVVCLWGIIAAILIWLAWIAGFFQ